MFKSNLENTFAPDIFILYNPYTEDGPTSICSHSLEIVGYIQNDNV